MSRKEVITLEKVRKPSRVRDCQLEQEVDGVILYEIAQHIVDYKAYGLELGLSEADITAKALNYQIAHDVKLITAAVFQEWHNQVAFDATYLVLVNVAIKLGKRKEAEKICKICAQEVPKGDTDETDGSYSKPIPESSSSVTKHVPDIPPSSEAQETMTCFCTDDDTSAAGTQASSGDATPGFSSALVRLNLRWDTDHIDTLMVHFLNPEVLENERWKSGNDPLVVSTILAWARFWNKPEQRYPKIANVITSKEKAHIRVEFTRQGNSQSCVGNTARNVLDLNKPTMYLNLYNKDAKLQQSLVLHEFGHALGLDHEHQRSVFWDVLESKDQQNQYRFIIGKSEMKSGNGGCQKAGDEHFRKDYQDQQLEFSDYDSASIMHYWFDKNWLLPRYRELSYDTEDLSGIEKSVLRGVHARDWQNGELAENPSQLDYDTLNKAYSLPRFEHLDPKWILKVVKNLVKYKGVILFVVVLVVAVACYFFFQ